MNRQYVLWWAITSLCLSRGWVHSGSGGHRIEGVSEEVASTTEDW